MPKLNKKVEKLRSFFTTKKQVEDLIENLSEIGEYKEEDLLLMESFKRVFHKGVEQLKIFIEDLDRLGPEVDEYTIYYYVKQILNSPFGGIALELTKDKRYWKKAPDIMGVNGNLNRSNTQTHILDYLPLNREILTNNVVTLRKIPPFVEEHIRGLEYSVDSMMTYVYDSPLQLDNFLSDYENDYKPTNREPHGYYFVPDTHSWENTQKASEDIFKKVEDYLEEEDYRMYVFYKTYNPFLSDDNVNRTIIDVLKRKVYHFKNIDSDEKVLEYVNIYTDLAGRLFEADAIRANSIKIETSNRNINLKLHTLKDQLGDILTIKRNPISQ
jgi:hypothetical protein